MTDGTVTQKTKYHCIAHEGSMQADELRVFYGQLWCSDCWHIHSKVGKRWDQLDRFADVQVAEQQPAAWARMKGGKVADAFADRALAEFVAGFAVHKLVPLYLHPQPAPDVAVPEGYAILPKELTAENGAKSILIGEFYSEIVVPCPDCEGGDGSEDYDCGFCNSSGTVTERVPVSWTTIKEIWRKAAIALAAYRKQGGES